MHNIRTKLFWLLDLLLMLFAFFVTGRWVAPVVRDELTSGRFFYIDWAHLFSAAKSTGVFSPLSQFFWVFALVAPATILFMDLMGGHIPISRQRPSRILLTALTATVLGVAILSTLFFVLRTPGYSRIFVWCFAATSALLMCGARLFGRWWHSYTLSEGIHSQEIAIVGSPEAINVAMGLLAKSRPAIKYKVSGYFALPEAPNPHPSVQLPCLGSVGDLEDVLVHQPIAQVVMILPATGAPWLETATKNCDYFRVTVHIVPEYLLNSKLADLIANTEDVPGHIPALTLAPPESQPSWLFLKRLTDVIVSATMLFLLLPILFAIAIAIKITTPHLPVFYPWRVVGYRGRRFTGYKFTTMIADADSKKQVLASLNEMTGPVFKIANDPRVTPLGKFLRKYSLNELPQFWSVLRGDMSLVGPRPAGPHELANYEMWHKRKLSAQPGITCLWQVMGRNQISNFDDWVRLDLEYIQKRTFWFDCKILAQTAWVVVRGSGS